MQSAKLKLANPVPRTRKMATEQDAYRASPDQASQIARAAPDAPLGWPQRNSVVIAGERRGGQSLHQLALS